MKTSSAWAMIIALLTVFTLSCGGGGGGGGSSSDSGGDTPLTLGHPRFVYSVNSTANTVSVYWLDATTGRLRLASIAATGPGTAPVSITVDPSNLYAYVANSGNGTVSQYTVGADGALTPMAPASVAAGNNPQSVTVDP
ncbi:MAG: beta-propeller fold lactonase family protein, partial [Syntrophaceae bacterium]